MPIEYINFPLSTGEEDPRVQAAAAEHPARGDALHQVLYCTVLYCTVLYWGTVTATHTLSFPGSATTFHGYRTHWRRADGDVLCAVCRIVTKLDLTATCNL